MSDARKLKNEFQSMLRESKYYLGACKSVEYVAQLNKIEGEANYFTKLEKYENVLFLNLFYKNKCKKASKDLCSFLLELHSSLGEGKWSMTEKFVESNR